MTTTYREATADDSPKLYQVSETAIGDFARRQGFGWTDRPDDPAVWARHKPLFDHLATIADLSWVAEQDGEIIGYARSIAHEGVRELTEFFVRPDRQAAGVGRELLQRAFPAEGSRQRLIVATSNPRALIRYLKSGVVAHCPIYDFRRAPEARTTEGDLTIEPITDAAAVAEELAAIDRGLLGFRRDADHAWLARLRQGFVARRGGAAAGYGYVGKDNTGPLAAVEASDLPALLAHAENLAHSRGAKDIGFEVPLINKAAVNYLLERGFQMQPFFAFLMSDGPVAGFERYVLFSPPFFV